MIKEEDLTIIGKLIKPHGIKGEINAELDVDDIALENFKCIILDMDGIFVPFFISAVRPKSHFVRLIKIIDIDNESDAGELSGKNIFVLTSELSQFVSVSNDDDNVYLSELVGFDAFDINNGYIGKITDIDDSTENVLFVLEININEKIFIPAVEDFIFELNIDKKQITFDLPDGLVTLNNN